MVLRQGDPLSPSLFILMAEYLSRGIINLYQKNPCMYYKNKGLFPLSHLSYADDCIIFCNGQKKSIETLMNFLKAYESVSGQRINDNKNIFLPGQNVNSMEIRRQSGYDQGSLPLQYLGIPLYIGKKRASCLSHWWKK